MYVTTCHNKPREGEVDKSASRGEYIFSGRLPWGGGDGWRQPVKYSVSEVAFGLAKGWGNLFRPFEPGCEKMAPDSDFFTGRCQDFLLHMWTPQV